MTHLRTNALKGRHFLRVADWKPSELKAVLDLGDELKMLLARGRPHKLLPGRSIALISTRPPPHARLLRGRHLPAGRHRGQHYRGAHPPGPRRDAQGHGLRALALRRCHRHPHRPHSDVDELVSYSSVPVLNALTDSSHPCQALADVMTIRERYKRLDGVRLAFFGDGNNVCASLMVAAPSSA